MLVWYLGVCVLVDLLCKGCWYWRSVLCFSSMNISVDVLCMRFVLLCSLLYSLLCAVLLSCLVGFIVYLDRLCSAATSLSVSALRCSYVVCVVLFWCSVFVLSV